MSFDAPGPGTRSPDQFRLRAPELGDAPSVLEVMHARDLANLGVVDYTLEDLHEEWAAHDFDLPADAVVCERDSHGIVAYAVLRRSGSLVNVDPAHEGQGIGTQLLRWVERRERERGRTAHRQLVAAADAGGQQTLRDAGYVQVRSYWRLTRALDGPLEAPAPPPGVELLTLEVDRDGAELHALDEVCFGASPDYRPESSAAFSEEHLQAHDLAPGLSYVAVKRQRIIGFLIANRWQEDGVGYIDLLAVHPDARRQGLGASLLRAAFGAFAAEGLREAQLGVASDNPNALRLYEHQGMTVRFQLDAFERNAS